MLGVEENAEIHGIMHGSGKDYVFKYAHWIIFVEFFWHGKSGGGRRSAWNL